MHNVEKREILSQTYISENFRESNVFTKEVTRYVHT